MQDGRPSRTAFGAAAYRAAHQVMDRGAIFPDPFALAVLGERGEAAVAKLTDLSYQIMRLFIAARSRFADDALSAAVARSCHERDAWTATKSERFREVDCQECSSSSSAFACFRSSVSKPSVNHP
jgi:Leucine carboxyl methyltransferase